MKYVKLLLVFAFALLPMAGFAEKGDMWEVKDADLTVWDSPNYLTKLGMMHQGDTFEEEGMDGDMIRFLYKGKTAYVASYCCQRFEPEPDSDVDVEEEMPAAATQQDAKEDAKNEKTELAAVAQQKGKQASNADAKKEDMQAPAGTQQSAEKEETGVLMSIALLLLSLVGGALGLIAIVFTFFYVFRYQKLAKWMNGKCGTEVIPYKRFNKLLLVPVLAALATVVITILFGYLATLAEQDSTSQIFLSLTGVALTIATPVLCLWYRYKKDKEQYGKKAASWMMLYSFLSIVTIYLICVVIAYIIVGIVAVLIFALIVSLAFPTRYYVVRRW